MPSPSRHGGLPPRATEPSSASRRTLVQSPSRAAGSRTGRSPISCLEDSERPAWHHVGSVRSPAPTDRQLHGPLRVQLRQGTTEQVRPGSKHPVGAALSRPGSRKDNELQPTERFGKTAFVERRRSAASAKFLLVELDDHPREQRQVPGAERDRRDAATHCRSMLWSNRRRPSMSSPPIFSRSPAFQKFFMGAIRMSPSTATPRPR